MNVSRGVPVLCAAGVLVSFAGCNRPAPYRLEDAIEKGDRETVQRCLAEGVDVNFRYHPGKGWGYTPLHVACAAGQKQIAEILVAAGADPHAANCRGQTPLEWTVKADTRRGQLECFKYLLQLRADPNAQDCEGTTALTYAARLGKPEYVRVLIAAGADVNHQDKGGWTALHATCHSSFYFPAQGQFESARLLLDAGADAKKADHGSRTPVDLARQEDRVDLLREFAARGLIPKDSIPEEKPKIPEEKDK